ncbi:hypothetical protein BFM99_19175 [Stutzerimonas stutzeri]|nr:hypothetical protein BFM99_19175 [Stutzerimonas stutzeri]
MVVVFIVQLLAEPAWDAWPDAGQGSAHVDVRGDFEAQTQIAEVRIDPLHGVSPFMLSLGNAVPQLEAKALCRGI